MECAAAGAARRPGRRPPAAAAHRHQQSRCKEGLEAGCVAHCVSAIIVYQEVMQVMCRCWHSASKWYLIGNSYLELAYKLDENDLDSCILSLAGAFQDAL